MKKAFATLALAGLVAFSGQAALAGTHHVRGKLMRPLISSERIRNAHASVQPTGNWTNQVFRYDEALSPPAGH
jgi:hypothetical protein